MACEITNMFLSLAEGLASLMGYKLVITLDEHKIDLKFVKPGDFRRKEAFYDDAHYVNGNIFLDGYANPVKPVFDKVINAAEEIGDNDDIREILKLKPSLNYKTFVRESKWKQLAEVEWNKTNWMALLKYGGIGGLLFLAYIFVVTMVL